MLTHTTHTQQTNNYTCILGIQTCFYNGMDDYAKMWLQLAFPFYLIFIAMAIHNNYVANKPILKFGFYILLDKYPVVAKWLTFVIECEP